MPLVTLGTIWMDRVAVMLAAVHNCTLLSLLVFQLKKSSKKQKNLDWHIRLMNTWAICTIFVYTCYNALRAPVSFGSFKHNCTLQSALLATVVTTGKLFSYLFYTSRLDVAFRYSHYQMSRTAFSAVYSIIVIGYATQQLLIGIFWKGIFITKYHNVFCATDAPEWMYWGTVAGWDFIVSCLLFYLFITRLWKAQFRRSSINHQDVDTFMVNIAKYFTLTIVSILTTLVCITISGLTSWITLVAIDTCVSCWCVFLMYGTNRIIFQNLCSCCHKSMQRCCLWYSRCCFFVTKNKEYNINLMHAFSMKRMKKHRPKQTDISVPDNTVTSPNHEKKATKDETQISSPSGILSSDIQIPKDSQNTPNSHKTSDVNDNENDNDIDNGIDPYS